MSMVYSYAILSIKFKASLHYGKIRVKLVGLKNRRDILFLKTHNANFAIV